MAIHVLHGNGFFVDASRDSASAASVSVPCCRDGRPEANEPKIPTGEVAERICSNRMESNLVRTNLQPSEFYCPLTTQWSARSHIYLDVIDAAYL